MFDYTKTTLRTIQKGGIIAKYKVKKLFNGYAHYKRYQDLAVKYGTEKAYDELNLLDFSRKDDVFLCDPYNDRLFYGGATTYNIKHETSEKSLRIYGELRKQIHGNIIKPYLFSGLICGNLYDSKFEFFDGVRVVAKTNGHPIKISINMSFDYLIHYYYSAYIVDDSYELRSYEIPFSNMISDADKESKNRMVTFPNAEAFKVRDIAVVKQTSEEGPYDFSIRKIDFIKNNEYPEISKFYKLPLMFKSVPRFGEKYKDYDFLDIGREKVTYGGREAYYEQFAKQSKMKEQNVDQEQGKQTKSVKERLSEILNNPQK